MKNLTPLTAWLRNYRLLLAPLSLLAATALPMRAAEAAADSNASTSKEDLVQMSAFEVRTTQGKGYSAGNSASALKTSDSLMNLPGQILVITNDMIHDIGSHVASENLAFAGLIAGYRGPSIISRGNAISGSYVDDAPQATGAGVSDNTNIDSYQVIKGPQQALYPLASLGGLVLSVTKKPLPHVTRYEVDEIVQQWGKQTFTFDVNQPIGNLGSAVITTRIEGIAQFGNGVFYNVHDDKWAIYPNISIDWKGTNLVFEYGAIVQQWLPGGTQILTPTGDLYTGLGARNQGTPPHDYDHFEQHDLRAEWTQTLSDEWAVKTQATFFNSARGASSAGFPTGVNWNNNTITYTLRLDDGWQAAALVQSDVRGKYDLFHLPMTTAFGFNEQDQLGISKFLTVLQGPGGTTIPSSATVPIGNAAAINAIVFPTQASFAQPGGNPGSRQKTYVANGYFSQTIDVMPGWLTLVGGLTFSQIETIADTNIAVKQPYISTDQNAHQLLHRLAALVHLTKNVTAYWMESTTFSPGAGADYFNIPLPNILGVDDEIGAKVSFLDGKISATVAVYKMQLTNQAVLVAYPALNVAGLNYYTPIGLTNLKGYDGSFTILPFPGLQMVGTLYQGTVRDQLGSPISRTAENSWSLFARYEFPKDSALNKFAIGGGGYKSGGRWFTMSGLTLPGNAPLPVNASGLSVFKLHQEMMLDMFGYYRINRHWEARLTCNNVLNNLYPMAGQGVGLIDPADPRTFAVEVTVRY